MSVMSLHTSTVAQVSNVIAHLAVAQVSNVIAHLNRSTSQ